MITKERLLRYFFPQVPESDAAAHLERCADKNLLWGQRLAALVFAQCVATVAWAAATQGAGQAVGLALAAAFAFGMIFAGSAALRAGAEPPLGMSKPASASVLTVAFCAALAGHALATWAWAWADAADRAGSLMLIAIAANVVLMPTVRRMYSVALVFMADAAFVTAAALIPGDADNAQTRVGVVVIAVIGTVGASFMHRYRALASIQHEALAQKNMLLADAVKKLVITNERLENISSTDELTSLNNRRSFASRLDSYWAWSLRSKTSIALILVDIDDFKLFNDNYGHLKGDLCLQEIAGCLLASVSREMDFVARIGGEEFMIIVCGVSEDGMRFIAEKVRKNVENANIEHLHSTVSKRVTVSIGCALMVPSHAAAAMDLINQADIALYGSKRTGKNRYTVFKRDE